MIFTILIIYIVLVLESTNVSSFCLVSSWQRKEAEGTPQKKKNITDADYADDIALPANIPAQAKTQLHRLEKVAAGIGLHVNAHKTEYMCFNQTGDISIQNSCSLKLVDKLTYLGSSVSTTETDIDTRLVKAWTTNNRLSLIWKSDQTDKMKRSFFSSRGRVDTGVWMHFVDSNETHGEKASRQLHKNAASHIEQVLEATPQKAAAIRPLTTHHEN